MTLRQSVSLIPFLSACLVLASPSPAGTFHFQPSGGSGNWNVAANWQENAVPVGADRAVILSGNTCVLDGARTVDTIEVESGATVQIPATYSLTLENDNDQNGNGDPDNSIVDGMIELAGVLGPLGGALNFVNESHIVSGDGTIFGDKNSEIRIADGLTFTSRLDNTGNGVRGAFMHVYGPSGSGTGTFRNEGNAVAVPSTNFPVSGLILEENLVLEDASGAVWSAEPNGVLTFRRTATNLVGNFWGACDADIRIFALNNSVEIRTCGTFARTGCAVTLDASGSLTARFRFRTYSTDWCDNNSPSVATGLSACNQNWLYEVPQNWGACSCSQ